MRRYLIWQPEPMPNILTKWLKHNRRRASVTLMLVSNKYRRDFSLRHSASRMHNCLHTEQFIRVMCAMKNREYCSVGSLRRALGSDPSACSPISAIRAYHIYCPREGDGLRRERGRPATVKNDRRSRGERVTKIRCERTTTRRQCCSFAALYWKEEEQGGQNQQIIGNGRNASRSPRAFLLSFRWPMATFGRSISAPFAPGEQPNYRHPIRSSR